MQREMAFYESLKKADWVPDSIVTGWKSYRDAVLWCWDNRKRNSHDSQGDQRVMADVCGLHSPHASRCVNPHTKAPMDLPADCIPDFENHVGWRGITQYMSRINAITPMEEVIARRAA